MLRRAGGGRGEGGSARSAGSASRCSTSALRSVRGASVDVRPSFPPGYWYYFRSCDVAELSDEVIDITAEHALRLQSPLTAFPIFHLGGAITRVGEDDTVFSGRRAGHTFNINATTATSEGFDREREWSQNFWSALAPHHTSVYVNFLMEEGRESHSPAYGSDK